MSRINPFYGQLPPAFFFTRLNDAVAAYVAAHPDQRLLRHVVVDQVRQHVGL